MEIVCSVVKLALEVVYEALGVVKQVLGVVSQEPDAGEVLFRSVGDEYVQLHRLVCPFFQNYQNFTL